jgi:hypothetical protein
VPLTHQMAPDHGEGLLCFSIADLSDDSMKPAAGQVNEPGKMLDAVVLGYAYPFGISGRAKGAFEAEGLTGWRARPLRIKGWQGQPYWALVVDGRCGALDLAHAMP